VLPRSIVLGAVVLLALCGQSRANVIVNPSFEYEHDGLMPNGASTEGHDSWGMPDDWNWRRAGAMNGHALLGESHSGWCSDGDWGLYLFASSAGPHDPGDYLEFYQTADLTGVAVMTFDVHLTGSAHTDSYVAIDSQKKWVRHAAGTLYGVTIDVSNLSGLHEIELGVEVFEPFGIEADGYTHFDNLIAVPEPITPILFAIGALLVARSRR